MLKHPPEVLAYFARVGAETLNWRRAIIKTYRGNYYIERAMVRISEDGVVTCSIKDYAPTDEEAKAMKEALAKMEFPRAIIATKRQLDELPFKKDMFVFYDRETGGITMVQQRKIRPDGVKHYVPWVYMNDGQWASMEPEGGLPFWKPEVGRGPGAKIMIHEGAKAAAAANSLPEDHPWFKEFQEFEHWGLIGGALAPHRTDYDELVREAPTEVVYFCDNDQPGVSALQKVAQCWGKPLKGIVTGKEFPPSWDVADPMPKGLYTRSKRYIGPSVAQLMEPATWATELVPMPKGRPITIIRPDFASEWLHCVAPEAFIHVDWPNRILTAAEFNSKVAPFSHVDDTARLLKKDFSSKAAVLKYVPGQNPGIYGGGPTGMYINTFCPSNIVAESGDAAPFLEFMAGLIPDEKDRFETLRWCATLIARPDIRMLYGLLLISEMQGVGKGTLGEKILAPLVGEINVSYPSEQEIVESQFNYWLAHKRLAVVHEIYAGHSSKAYNKLKTIITDRFITVQKKYQANYEIESWIHVIANSNSTRALKLSMDDRRWMVPQISEEKRPAKYWEELNGWLSQDGGLSIIAAWAKAFVEEHGPVERGAAAPWTALKRVIVEEGYSPGQTLVSRALDEIKDQIEDGKLPPDSFVLDSDLVALIRAQIYEGRHNDRLEKPVTVRAVAKAQGWHVGDVRASVRAWGPEAAGARVLSLSPIVAATQPGDLKGRPVKLGSQAAM